MTDQVYEESPYVIRGKELNNLVLIGVLFVLFNTFFVSYSLMKFKSLENGSFSQQSVKMRVVQHNVRAVCPQCGHKSTPLCSQDKVDLYWNGAQGTFVCPTCGQGGYPICSKCKHTMTWVEAK